MQYRKKIEKTSSIALTPEKSSGIENIVTTHDEIYKAMVKINAASPATKEVTDYRAAIWKGYNLVKEKQIINTNIIVKIQEKLEHNQAGIRSTLGTVIKNTAMDEVVYTPPQEKTEILVMKHELRDKTKIYSKELLEALFFEFYTKIPYIQEQLKVSDKTAQKYLDTLVELGFLTSEKIGRERIYKNERLFKIIKEADRE